MSLATSHVIKEPHWWVWCLLQPYTSSKNQACGFDVSCSPAHHQRTKLVGLMSLAVSHIIKEPSRWVWWLLQSRTSSKNQAWGFDVSCNLTHHQRTKPEGLTSLATLHIIKEPSPWVWSLSLAISGVKSLKKQACACDTFTYYKHKMWPVFQEEKKQISKIFETGLQQSWREKQQHTRKRFCTSMQLISIIFVIIFNLPWRATQLEGVVSLRNSVVPSVHHRFTLHSGLTSPCSQTAWAL